MKTKKPVRTIFKRPKRNRFTQIDNKPLQEKGLSLEAIGLLVCVLSLPDNFEFGREWARWRFDIGREKLDRIIKELKEAGYVQFEQERDENNRLGKAVYLFTDEAGNFTDDEPLTAKPYYGSPVAGKPNRKAGNGTLYKEDKNKKRGADALKSSLQGEGEGCNRPATPEPQCPEKRREIGEMMKSLAASLNVSKRNPFDRPN